MFYVIMIEDVPARQARAWYFEGKDVQGRQKNFCAISSIDLVRLSHMIITKHSKRVV